MAGNIFTLFLGSVPVWYKNCVLAFLLINPLVLYVAGAFAAGWLLVLEFIFTLVMALRCYPLQPGGLLALEAVVLGMAKPDAVYAEVSRNLPVLLLLMFMVAGIFFMQ
ncbi:MAG: sodium/proton antiporter, partial [Gammaproteobacteria bacterium]|nr:sodium/proton antiporter [Gammaproteobacteria bacterium]